MGAWWAAIKWIGAAIQIVIAILEAIGSDIIVILIETAIIAVQITAALSHFIIDMVLKVITLDFQAISNDLASYGEALSKLMTSYAHEAIKTVAAIKQNFKTLLQIINFKYLRVVHTIGIFVSEDYRKTVGKFWSGVAQISTALRMAGETLPTLLRITQSSHQMFSSMIGENYEAGHLRWMKSVSSWEGWEAMQFENTEQSFASICDWIDGKHQKIFSNHGMPEESIDILWGYGGIFEGEPRPQILEYKGFNVGLNPDIFDGIAAFQKVMIGQTEAGLEIADATVQKIYQVDKKIDDKLERLEFGIGEKIEKIIEPAREEVQDFIVRIYEPAISYIVRTLDKQKHALEEIEKQIKENTEKMKKPGNLLTSVDYLEDLDRIDQEYKIAEVASRSISRDTKDKNKEILEDIIKTEERWGKITTDTPQPKYTVKEAEGLITKPGTKPKPGQTWFAGDF